MYRSAWFLARKDVQYMLRAKETVFWTFLMPIVFFYFIGSITGGFGGSSGNTKDPLVADIHPEAGFLASHLEQRLATIGFDLRAPETVDSDSRIPRLQVPAAFTDSVLAGNEVTLTLTRKTTGLGADYDDFRIQRAVYTLLGDLVAATDPDHPPTLERLSILAQNPKTLELDVAPAGKRKHIPTGFEQAIPGTMVMFTLLVLLTSGATLMVIERKQGLLERLASSPLSRPSIVLGKWGGRWILGLIQLAFAMFAGSILFGMEWGSNLPTLVLVLFVYSGLIALLGMLLGSIARTEGQAIGIGVMGSNILAALGGCWWPIEITPDWMQKLAILLPTGWAMDALHKLVSFGAPPQSVIPHLVVMILSIAILGWLTNRLFRFQ